MKIAYIALFGLALCCAAAKETLQTGSSASVTVVPDLAIVQLVVSVTRPSVIDARDENAETVLEVVDALGTVNGVNTTTDIQTFGITVYPAYSYDDTTGVSNITGYTFSQTIQVTVRELTNDLLAEVIDTSVRAGGDLLSINSISADASAPIRAQAQRQARRAAVEDAIDIANLLADAAGVKLQQIDSLVDGTGSAPVPVPFAGSAKASSDEAAVGTTISVGTIEIDASVSITYQIS